MCVPSSPEKGQMPETLIQATKRLFNLNLKRDVFAREEARFGALGSCILFLNVSGKKIGNGARWRTKKQSEF